MIKSEYGIILRRYQEQDNTVVSLLSDSGVLIPIRIHGLSVSKKRSRVVSEPGTLIHATYYTQPSTVSSMREVDVIERFENTKKDYRSLQILAYFLTLTELGCNGTETEYLFPLLKGTLGTLNNPISLPENCPYASDWIPLLVIFFKIRMVKGLGLIGDADHCSSCNAALTDTDRYITRNSGFLCSNCTPEPSRGVAESNIIYRATHLKFANFVVYTCKICAVPTTSKNTNSILDSILDDYLDRRPEGYQSVYSIWNFD